MVYLFQHGQICVNAKERHREQSKMAYRLLEYGLLREYGLAALPGMDKNEYGKPCFPEYPGIYFNVSHCPAGILCGIGKSELGVDIERILEYKEKLARRVTHANEWELLQAREDKAGLLSRIWVCKESYLKYLGTGINRDLRLLDFSECGKDRFTQYGCSFFIRETPDFCMAVCAKNQPGEMETKVITVGAADFM